MTRALHCHEPAISSWSEVVPSLSVENDGSGRPLLVMSSAGGNSSDDATQWITVGEDRVRLLRDGTEAFPVMLGAIRAARREILLEMYWFGSDAVGEEFRRALIERALAGVLVRVIFDSFGSLGASSASWARLREAGAWVSEYAPILPSRRRLRFWRPLGRDHRKFLVVDGEVAFTGGINLGDPWAPPGRPERAWRDDEIEIRGRAAAAFRCHFHESWEKCCGGAGVGSVESADRPSADQRIKVLANRIGLKGGRVIRSTYVEMTTNAERSIDVSNAYFLPGPILLHALRRAATRGRRVRILVPEHSDVALVALAMTSLYVRLLADGVEVYAYRPRMLHTKTAIFDGRWTTTGSHNLDSLSWRFNLECNVVIDSEALAAKALAGFERDLAQATRLGLEAYGNRPLWLRLLGWFAALFRYFL